MTPAEVAAVKAEALREFAARHAGETRVLYVDLDRGGREVRVSTLALDDAAQLEREAAS